MSISLLEDSRSNLLNQSKSSEKGMQRMKRRTKSKVARNVREFNSIDMNKLFKEGILTLNISVHGETADYIVRISFGGFLRVLHDALEKNGKVLDLKVIIRALSDAFNREDVYIHCSCPDFKYRFNYWVTRKDLNSGEIETRPSDITNPKDTLGAACKHVLLVLSNNSWLIKVASVINNYIKYMEKHYKRLYSDVIYPAIYDEKYTEPVQIDIFDTQEDELAGEEDTNIIDTSNEYGRTSTQFKQGNKQGVKFTKTTSDNGEEQIDLLDN